MAQWTIYCHTHTDSGRRYIGLTKKTMMQRWNQHVLKSGKDLKTRSFLWSAIRKYGKDAFAHQVLEICKSLEEANTAEEAWIESFSSRDPQFGFNLAKGGGSYTLVIKNNPWDRPEYRAKVLSPAARAASKAALNTPAVKAKIGALAKTAMSNHDTIAKRKIFQQDPLYGARIAEKLKESLSTPEARERMRRSSIESSTSEVQERRAAAIRIAVNTPECKAQRSEISREMWTRPDVRAKYAARVTSPETRALIAAASTGKRHSEESIKKQRELYLVRSSSCKFCDKGLGDTKRTCIKGRVACLGCYTLHRTGLASFVRPDNQFV